MKELKFEELTVKQKLGMVMVGQIKGPGTEENTEYALEMIRNHALGGIWINPKLANAAEVIARVKEAADYPILIMCDAEEGIGGHYIGRQNPIGCLGETGPAYAFGKVQAVTARKLGYNATCNLILDRAYPKSMCGATTRCLGGDKYKVAEIGAAIARGMHDGGVLVIGKHYPSAPFIGDSHMCETLSDVTEEELREDCLYPYLKLMEEGLLDGVMSSHRRIPKIDPDFPATFSEKILGIIRKQGFDGFIITDALSMMGVVAKFGRRESKGLAIARGNDLALPFHGNQESYEAICESYEQGVLTEERLDEAVRRVLEAQHKVMVLDEPKYTELSEHDLEEFDRINRDSIYARTDEGVPVALPKDRTHLFVVLKSLRELYWSDKETADQLAKDWYKPYEIQNKLKELYPNSGVMTVYEFPDSSEMHDVLEESTYYDDVVFITYNTGAAYIGRECLTSRVVSLIEALQVTNRVSTIVHFGNPFVLEELVHIPRVLIGGVSADSVNYALDILEGKYPAKGCLSYDVKLK